MFNALKLKIHMVVHSAKNKLYKYNISDKGFNQLTYLKMHEMRHE